MRKIEGDNRNGGGYSSIAVWLVVIILLILFLVHVIYTEIRMARSYIGDQITIINNEDEKIKILTLENMEINENGNKKFIFRETPKKMVILHDFSDSVNDLHNKLPKMQRLEEQAIKAVNTD